MHAPFTTHTHTHIYIKHFNSEQKSEDILFQRHTDQHVEKRHYYMALLELKNSNILVGMF